MLLALAAKSPMLVLAWRHLLVWRRRLLANFALYIAAPLVLMYGLAKAFNLDSQLDYIVPGFMVNTAVVGCFISCTYGTMERFYGYRYESWMGATLGIAQLVGAEAVFQAFKGMMLASGIWVAALLLGLAPAPLDWLLSMPVVALCSVISALMGYALAGVAKSYDDISLTEPVLTGLLVFSGVFVAATIFPLPLQWIVQLLPVYHGIELIRPLFTGDVLLWGKGAYHMAWLAIQTFLCWWLAVTSFKRRLIT